jgi:hypothetical protein
LCPSPELLYPCKCHENSIICGGTDSLNLKRVFENIDQNLGKNEKNFTAFYLNNTAIAEIDCEILNHSFYSPDMNTCDFHAIKEIESALKGRRFHDEAGPVSATSAQIVDLNESGSFTGINSLPKQWNIIIEICGDYIVK